MEVNSVNFMEFKYLENGVISKLKHINSNMETLKKLKLHFRNKINSKRTYERIHKFDELFKVLNKRYVISHEKINAFLVAIKMKGSSEEECNLEQEFLNLVINNQHSYDKHEDILENNSPICKHLYPLYFDSKNDLCRKADLQKKVMLEISERIGNKWRNLARYLDVKESLIDEIEFKYTDLKEKAYQILKMSQAQLAFENWISKLIYALNKNRRRDLSDWVEDEVKKN